MAQVAENIVAFDRKDFQALRQLNQLSAFLCGSPPRRVRGDQSVEFAAQFE